MIPVFRLLLPALIPSWRFFDVIAASPRIEYALLQAKGETARDWREFRPRPPRLSLAALFGRLVWNARWNEALFVVSCAERVVDEPTAHSEDEIFHRIAADLADRHDTSGAWLSFRIVLLSEQQGALDGEVAFVADPRRLATIPVR